MQWLDFTQSKNIEAAPPLPIQWPRPDTVARIDRGEWRYERGSAAPVDLWSWCKN
jgi:hypothetical protein